MQESCVNTLDLNWKNAWIKKSTILDKYLRDLIVMERAIRDGRPFIFSQLPVKSENYKPIDIARLTMAPFYYSFSWWEEREKRGKRGHHKNSNFANNFRIAIHIYGHLSASMHRFFYIPPFPSAIAHRAANLVPLVNRATGSACCENNGSPLVSSSNLDIFSAAKPLYERSRLAKSRHIFRALSSPGTSANGRVCGRKMRDGLVNFHEEGSFSVWPHSHRDYIYPQIFIYSVRFRDTSLIIARAFLIRRDVPLYAVYTYPPRVHSERWCLRALVALFLLFHVLLGSSRPRRVTVKILISRAPPIRRRARISGRLPASSGFTRRDLRVTQF